MLFSKEIEGLHDDGFEGSIDERRIFTDLFFGNDHGRTSKRCLVTGVINFECDYSKQTDVLLHSNSENSGLTSQVDSCNVKGDSRENSGSGYGFSVGNDHDVNGKRIKLSVDEFSYSRSSSGKSVCHVVVCRLVESSSQGVTSSCYLLKRHAETNPGSDMGDRDVSKCRLPKLDGSNRKKVSVSKAIASPVSQESFATKLLVTSPSATVADKSESLHCAKERVKPTPIHEPLVAKIMSNKDSKKDPRPLLRNHIQNLLRAAGWDVGQRIRNGKANAAFIYFPPQGGSPIREFHRAWNFFGQCLFADGKVVVEEDGKQWTNMTDFWCDLSNTVIKIEEECNNTENTAALAHRWCLLDPFANMVFIDKKLGTLREGKVVKARRSLVIDISTKDDAVLTTKNVDSCGNQSEIHSPDQLQDSSLVRESALTNSEGCYRVCNEKCGLRISENFVQLHRGTVKALKGTSVHLYEVCSGDAGSGTGTRHREFCGNKRSGQDPSSSQACEADGTLDHSSSCLLEVPVTIGNANIMLGGSEPVSPHQDSNTNSASGDGRRSDLGEEMALEVDTMVSKGSLGGKSFNGEVTDKLENQLKGSLGDHLNGGNVGDQDRTYVPLNTGLGSVSWGLPLVEDSHLVDVDDKEVMTHSGLIGKYSGGHIEASRFDVNGSSSVADAILKRMAHKKSEKMSEMKLVTLSQNDRLDLSANKAVGHDIYEQRIQLDSKEVQECFTATNLMSDRSCKKAFTCSSQSHIGKKQSRLRKLYRSSHSSKNLNQFSHDSEHSKELDFENITDEVPMHTEKELLGPENLTLDIKSEKPETCTEYGQKRSITCLLKDDDLLISAVIKNKTFRSTTKQSNRKKKSFKADALRKCKSQKGSCRLLLRSLGKGGKHTTFGVRTVLSWLIDSGVVSLNQVIQYRNLKDDVAVKDGLITQDGILCKCCSEVLSVSEFKIHAGFRLNRPCLNLVMESGKPFTLCQLEAWSAEYKARKSASRVVQVDEMDQNDDSCGLCGDGGALICCDNCPSTFHQACLYAQCLPMPQGKKKKRDKSNGQCSNFNRICETHCVALDIPIYNPNLTQKGCHFPISSHLPRMDDLVLEDDEDDDDMEIFLSSKDRMSDLPDYEELPEGSWYCPHCTCWICGDVVNDKEASKSPSAVKCTQCEHKYHEACLKEKGIYQEVVSDTWFCGESCEKVYLGLQSQIGLVNLLSDGFSWTLLRCIHGDKRVHSAQRFVALKAECNSKLAVALTIMEECFLSMLDPRTGIDMIPHVIYNWGSEFARLNYYGFYTMVLEKDDVLMSVASIRIHGVTVAEMPLIATCTKFRRQGMCRRLMNSIEEMLRSFKVEKLVISAIPSLVETWTDAFGFEPLEDNERRSLSNINFMVFPGTVWLKKFIYGNQVRQGGSGNALPLCSDDPTETGACSKGVTAVNFARQSDGSSSLKDVADKKEIKHSTGNNMQVDVDEDEEGSLHEHFSKLSCEEPASTVLRGSQPEMVCHVESVAMYDEREISLYEKSQKVRTLQDNARESVVMYDERELSGDAVSQKVYVAR